MKNRLLLVALSPWIWQVAASAVVLVALAGSGLDFHTDCNSTHHAVSMFAKENTQFSNGMKGLPTPAFTPNLATTVTGAFPEHHGIADDLFAVPESITIYDLKNVTGRVGVYLPKIPDGRLWQRLPIWEAAARHGKKVVVIGWPLPRATPGSHVIFRDSPSPDDGASSVLDLLKTHDLVIWYVNDDKITEGAEGRERYRKRADRALSRLIDGIQDRGLSDATDMVIVGSNPDPQPVDEARVFCMETGIDVKTRWFSTYGFYHFDREVSNSEVLEQLKKAVEDSNLTISVTFSERMDPALHMSPRLGHFAVLPTDGASVRWACGWKGSLTGPSLSVNRTGRVLLLAGGPSFAKGRQIKEVPGNEEVYGLLWSALGLHGPVHSPVNMALAHMDYNETEPAYDDYKNEEPVFDLDDEELLLKSDVFGPFAIFSSLPELVCLVTVVFLALILLVGAVVCIRIHKRRSTFRLNKEPEAGIELISYAPAHADQ